MEHIGINYEEHFSVDICSFKWGFSKVDFSKSYRCTYLRFPSVDAVGFHLAIVPDEKRSVVGFYIFLFGYDNLRSDMKITFSACLKDEQYPSYSVSYSDTNLDLKPSIKLFEIHSHHPIFFNCSGYALDFKLKVHEDITEASETPNTTEKVTPLPEKSEESVKYPEKLIQDLKSLHTSGDMHDLKICIGNDELHAHKLILCARSPVFKKMLQHDCIETLSNTITITDFSAALFERFLKYLYTAEIEDTTLDAVIALYSLGDKYDVTSLREDCSNILQYKFCSESEDVVANIVCDVLELAESHSDSVLKDLSSKFIVKHFPSVSSKGSWKDLMKNNVELTAEMLALIATGLHKEVYQTGEINK